MTTEQDSAGPAGYELPVFPLEQPILPSMVVPLHVFEPRYRQLAHDLQAMDEPTFGVIGIERGREVGGGEQRYDVGVAMSVASAEEFPDGRWALTTVASRRITVLEWLPDDPYPRARVADRLDDLDGQGAFWVDFDALLAEFQRLADSVRRHTPQLDLLADLRPADDLDWRTWELVSRAGLGPLDHVELLRTDAPSVRMRLAREMIADRRTLLDALAEGDR